MAKIGLKYPVYKGATSNTGVLGKAITADITIEQNNAILYADDAIAESDFSFKSGTITFGLDEMTDTIQTELLGHTVASSETTAAATDQPPYVGLGFYAPKLVAGVKKYRAIFIPKIRFKEPSESDKTKGEATEFGTYTIEGTILPDATGKWKIEKTFTLEADAIAYVNTATGLAVTASGGLTALSLAGTGGTLSPAFGAAIRSYTFGGVSAASVTVTATAASHTINLYIDGVWSQLLLSGTPSAAIPMVIGSKKLTIIAYEAGKQSQTTDIIVVKTS